jgi:hypothetical protein
MSAAIDALRRWLEVTREALAAPPELAIAALARAVDLRAQLQAELGREPAARPDFALQAELRAAELAFQARGAELRAEIGAHLEELRRVRSGTRGYRAPRPNHPTFLSRSV